jgi:hypothetical protein
MTWDQLHALSKAWAVTIIAVSLFLVSVGIRNVWDWRTYRRALEQTLLSDPF